MKTRGFSLAELLISVSILTIGLAVVINSLAYCAKMAGLSSDLIRAVLLADEKMQELGYLEKQNKINSLPLSGQGNQEKFSWQYVLSREPSVNLYRLDYIVSWSRAGRREQAVFNTYLR